MIHFSCICLTFARIARLEEAIACFLSQDYPGPKELIVLNSFFPQTLKGEFPFVRIINLTQRPPSLADARNMAIEAAAGTHIITWDDDDIYLPNHLSNFATNWPECCDWVWMDRQYYAERFKIQRVTQGTYNVFAFTKKAWESAGKYKAGMNCGEDHDFCTRVSTVTQGQKIVLPDTQLSFVYGWGNFVNHVSGAADKEKDWKVAFQRVETDAVRRVKRGVEPRGEILLKPKLEVDYPGQALDFSGPPHNSKVCIVQLGRYGDIINILPVAQHIHNTYGRPTIVCSEQFASLMEGVSYADCWPLPIQYDQLQFALRSALSKFQWCLISQIYAPGMQIDHLTPSFTEESWRLLGMGYRYKDLTLRPLFDKRDPAREETLLNKVRGNDTRPMVCVNFTSGISSPFADGASLQQAVFDKFGERFHLVDLAKVTGERFYDLLAVMEKSVAIVSCDTGTLHLATATDVPIVALVNSSPWLGSYARGNVVERITYNDARRDPAALLQAIDKAVVDRSKLPAKINVLLPPRRRIFHVSERHRETNPAQLERVTKSQETWQRLYSESGVIGMPLDEACYPRSACDMGNRRKLPYLKDILAPALKLADPHDIIFITNDDIHLHPDIAKMLELHIGMFEAASSIRSEWREQCLATDTPHIWNRRSQGHTGRDLFAFTARWLRAHWDDIPDFFVGTSHWDYCLASLVRLEFGILSSRQNIEKHFFPAEMPHGYIGHVMHRAFWCNTRIKEVAQTYNQQLFRDWCGRFPNEFKFHGLEV